MIRYRGLKSFPCCIFVYNGAILLVGLSFYNDNGAILLVGAGGSVVEHRAVTREVVSSTPAGPTLRVLKK